jgi:hypothetical protein
LAMHFYLEKIPMVCTFIIRCSADTLAFIQRAAAKTQGRPFFFQVFNLRIICLSKKKDVEKANKLGFKVLFWLCHFLFILTR